MRRGLQLPGLQQRGRHGELHQLHDHADFVRLVRLELLVPRFVLPGLHHDGGRLQRHPDLRVHEQLLPELHVLWQHHVRVLPGLHVQRLAGLGVYQRVHDLLEHLLVEHVHRDAGLHLQHRLGNLHGDAELRVADHAGPVQPQCLALSGVHLELAGLHGYEHPLRRQHDVDLLFERVRLLLEHLQRDHHPLLGADDSVGVRRGDGVPVEHGRVGVLRSAAALLGAERDDLHVAARLQLELS